MKDWHKYLYLPTVVWQGEAVGGVRMEPGFVVVHGVLDRKRMYGREIVWVYWRRESREDEVWQR